MMTSSGFNVLVENEDNPERNSPLLMDQDEHFWEIPIQCKNYLIGNAVYMLSDEQDHNKFIEVGYDIFSNLQPTIKIGCLGCSDIIDCVNTCTDRKNCEKTTTFSKNEWFNKLVFNEDYFLRGVLDDFNEEDNKIKELLFGTQYRCRLYRNDFIELFKLKDIINYRLNLLSSSDLPDFYRNFIKLVAELTEEETNERIISDARLILNSELNTNRHNILNVLEILRLYSENVVQAVKHNAFFYKNT